MLNEVQADAANDRYFVDGHGTKQLLDCDLLICDLGGGIENVVVCYADNLGLEASGLCCCADIEVWRRKNWLTPQFAAIGRNEADESVPVWCHCFVCVVLRLRFEVTEQLLDGCDVLYDDTRHAGYTFCRTTLPLSASSLDLAPRTRGKSSGSFC